MSASKEEQTLEFNSEMKYLHSKFDFFMKINENIFLEMALIYENTIEYYSKYNFIDVQNIFHQFKNIYAFIKYLNEFRNKYNIYISTIDKDNCKLSLVFYDNIMSSHDFILSNKNKNLNIESYKEKKLLNYNVDKIIELCKESESVILKDISFEPRQICYYFFFDNHTYIIFYTKIKVEIILDDNKNIEENIRTNYDIKKLIQKNNIDEKEVFVNAHNLGQIINYIDSYIKDGKLELKVIKKKILKAKFGQSLLKIDKDYSREQYSEYFSEYFENFNKKNNKKIFKFENNELRNEIYYNISKLRNSNEIQKYKITGPFSCGKSITLFVFSKRLKNVIYVNLKVLKKYYDDHKKCLEIIFSEISKVELNDNLFNEKIKALKIEQNILKQLLFIIELILECTSQNIVLILDQYKSENMHYEKTFPEEIKKFFNNKKFKLILCSSANDQKLREEIIKTWSEYKGNPHELNLETQEYYFYYYNLFFPKRSKTLEYKLFHKKYKYIKKLRKNKNIENIYNRIIEKLKNFHAYNKNIMTYSNIFNLSDILIFLKNNICVKINIINLLEIISMTPLKYFYVIIEKEYFIIKPVFPFIYYVFSKYIDIKECEDYFKNKKYSNISYLSNNVKGEYFEYSTIKALQDPTIIKLPSSYNKTEEVILKDIVKMDKLESSFDNLINEINDNINIIENEEEEEEKEEDIEDEEFNDLEEEEKESIEEINEDDIKDDNNDYIFVDMNNKLNINLNKKIEKDILHNKIKQIVSDHILKDFLCDFYKDIYNNNDEYNNLINDIEKESLKGINEYKKEILEEVTTKRTEKITLKIEETMKKKIKEKEKGLIKISMVKKNKKKNKKIQIDLKKYNGDETFFIIQGNKNGKLLDYAILYGEKNNKIFVGFKMKCYGIDTSLEDKFLDRNYIKKTLSPILLNSIKSFNCLIKQWHYFLIFYYNEEDIISNNVGFKTLLSSCKKTIEYLLFDPNRKIFLSKDAQTRIKELNLSDLSNLDNFTYINNCFHYISFPNNFFHRTNYEDFKKSYKLGLSQFVKDFKQYSKDPNNLLEALSKKLGFKGLFFCLSFHFEHLEMPIFNYIFLYKKKQSSYFIAIICDRSQLKIIDLEKEINLNCPRFNELIDFEYEYSYILRFEGSPKAIRECDDEFDLNYFVYLKEKIN